ncbi:unnamed protein product, partial [Polarella glacialis]
EQQAVSPLAGFWPGATCAATLAVGVAAQVTGRRKLRRQLRWHAGRLRQLSARGGAALNAGPSDQPSLVLPASIMPDLSKSEEKKVEALLAEGFFNFRYLTKPEEGSLSECLRKADLSVPLWLAGKNFRRLLCKKADMQNFPRLTQQSEKIQGMWDTARASGEPAVEGISQRLEISPLNILRQQLTKPVGEELAGDVKWRRKALALAMHALASAQLDGEGSEAAAETLLRQVLVDHNNNSNKNNKNNNNSSSNNNLATPWLEPWLLREL